MSSPGDESLVTKPATYNSKLREGFNIFLFHFLFGQKVEQKAHHEHRVMVWK